MRPHPATIASRTEAAVQRVAKGRPGVQFLVDLSRFSARQLLSDRAPQMAAALSYRTIFSLIPVLVLSLVVFKAFVGPDGIRYGMSKMMELTGLNQIRLEGLDEDEARLDNAPEVAPGTSETAAKAADTKGDAKGDGKQNAARLMGPPAPPLLTAPESMALTEKIQDFVDKTVDRFLNLNFGVIAVVGILVLIYGALSLMIQVEQAFNTVCRAPSGRKLRVRMINYWAVLTLGPLALIGGFLLGDESTKVLRELPGWAQFLTVPANLLVRMGLTWLLLILAYTLMPNTRMKLGPAAIGAFVAAAAWEAAKSSLTGFVANMTNPEAGGQMAVYGSLALVPIFLMWVYITWIIVLFGLELAFAIQTVRAGRHVALERSDKLPLVEPAIGVVIIKALAERFEAGKASTAADLSGRCGLAEPTVERVLDHLLSKELLHKVELKNDRDTEAYTLARPPATIAPSEVLRAMHELAGYVPEGGSAQSDGSILRLIRESQVEALRTLSLVGLGEASADENGTARRETPEGVRRGPGTSR